ncbi:transglycosylase SLT domain-containing protein [uncultured Roseovarius sp.]|uniref:transglycosylase SLT domain-containing protein n=1 Tax=uncultured Roseovarius sp. TaxID=293344 RepID=UPI000C4FDB90|nr:invasion protein [Roseovarius sp.]MBD13018.1 invasion protein [Roseovarius sp.]|tara:strand:+ start:1812 stop:2588 length:777 start_codon:yes stop_codon:yes gene_type:complete
MKYVILLCVTLFWVPSLALSSSANCEALAAQAAERHGLPKGLLRAIARTESGRAQGKAGAQAWAWTSNVRGKGYYYSGKQEALTHLRQLVARGVRGFDVGCMQLNYRWHGDNFANLDEMIDPARNTEYAARYLSELRAETGSWDAATRYYHSRDPRRGAAYLGRVRQAMARLGPVGTSPEMAQETEVARAAMGMTGPMIPPREAPRLAEPAPREDRRFAGSEPLVSQVQQVRYWETAALPEGTVPQMPARKAPDKTRR